MNYQKVNNKGMTLPELVLAILMLTAFTGVSVIIIQYTSRFFQPLNEEAKEEYISSNKELTYRILAQVASSVPNRVRFDQVSFNGTRNLVIQGVAASDQDILKFIDNLSKQKLVEQASLSSMRLPKGTAGTATMKGFRVFVKIKRG